MTKEEKSKPDVVSLTVPSHPKFLYAVRSMLYPVLIDAGFSRRETRHIILAVDEACGNVIKHAYGGDPTGTIALTVVLGDGELRVELKDRGRKPDPAAIAPRDLADVRPGGLGTHFINSVFETVRYDTSAPEGTLLTLIRRGPVRSRG